MNDHLVNELEAIMEKKADEIHGSQPKGIKYKKVIILGSTFVTMAFIYFLMIFILINLG